MTTLPNEPRHVELFDTSLRDGMQQPNLEISVPNAITLLERMSAFGVHYAEIGFAGAHQFVSDLTRALAGTEPKLGMGSMRLALFGRTRGRGMRVQDWPDARFILQHRQRIGTAVLVVKSRLLDVEKSLETTSEENLLMTRETVSYLQDHGLEVIVDLEHALDAACGRRECGQPCDDDYARRTLDYFHQVVAQCAGQNASRIVICDTTGGANPEEVANLFEQLKSAHPKADFGFHGHTDRGLGVANARAAILSGAMHVQGTLLGIGERCGNVNLTTVIGSMQIRDEARFVSGEQLRGLTSLAHTAYDLFSLDVPHGAPIVGPGAFGTWAGMHGSSERKNPGAYLWCDPARVGATPIIGVNRQSGKANILLLAETLGVPLTSSQAQDLMEANQPMIEGGGFTASEVSFRLACLRAQRALPDFFAIRHWRVMDESDEAGSRYVQAAMGLEIDGQPVTSRAEGAGPVDAMSRALRQEIERAYPTLQQMRLGRFSVTALDVSAHDSAAYVRVTVSFQADGHQPWVTAGVSSDMNQAALMAILDGFHHFLLLNQPDAVHAAGATQK
jgi:2-isopropylmalate synthase